MDLAKKNGSMAASIRDSILMLIRMGKESTVGLMETDSLENGRIICLMVKAYSFITMIVSALENGKITNYMEKAPTNGEMVECL